ncbi:MotB family flagellar motor rotation protein [Buttiauxella ferragutiae ATCC 51602]|jgi:chemotaxis protein MotB|uniref:MotB family flagellar motor rotation protein n=1 Tax=Buttiauxella ferragutiae ATCC 51602 TaxID=1354252 RepID=A0ABX2W9B2_9ENTR|nr:MULTISPECIES: flagellar motor protein MotB [Buttiauxella]OAT28112.1 MotB family flagellar motor rotation protein [Buttiauxella ferragutiae ATCC 51602]TDN49816.1 chemotaxis protein MotB [Buttiauxella sp. JUb87]
MSDIGDSDKKRNANNGDSEKKRKNSIIIKRVTKVNGSVHKGAWKVAFADFAISMMALFLVLWIMGATTEEQRQQMASAVESNEIVEFDGASSILEGAGGNTLQEKTESASSTKKEEESSTDASDEEKKEALSRLASYYESQAQLGQLATELTQTIQEMKVSDSVVIEVVEQGVRVRFQDQAKKPLFDSGSRQLSNYFVKILRNLAPAFSKINNKVMISGHSDATPLNNAFYSNWELSTERAISARHILVQNGMLSDRVLQLAGYADTMPLQGKDPLDPVNRRIEILILTEKGEKELKNMFKQGPASEPSAPAPSAPPAS